jgi:hypothetical protein
MYNFEMPERGAERSYKSPLVRSGSPIGLVLELLDDLYKQGRISSAEARVVMDLIQHPAMPEELRGSFRPTTPPPDPKQK